MAIDLVLRPVLRWVNSTVASGSCVKLNAMGIWKMNEQKLKELWWKARIGYNEQNCDPEVLAKFAELIVRECASKVDWILAEGGKTQGDLIKEHFGVKG